MSIPVAFMIITEYDWRIRVNKLTKLSEENV
jgi:hypothetical protein